MADNKLAVKDTAILATGSISAQAITLLLTPVVTRLFAPDQFGYFATIFALATPMVAISSLRYFDAIMLPKEDEEAFKLFQLSMILNVVCAALLLLIVFVFTTPLTELFGLQENKELLYVVPFFVLIIGGRRIIDAWLQRKKSYVAIASSSFTISIVDRIVTIGSGLLAYVSFWGLVAGRAVGVISGLVLMVVQAIRVGVSSNAGNGESPYSKTSVAKKYVSFAKYSWSGWVMQVTMELPVLVIGAYYNPVIVGLYVLSRRVLMEPAVLVGEALSKTFYVQAASLHKNNESISEICLSLILMLFKLSIPPMFVFAVAAPDLFSLVFGKEWRDAGTYAVYLIPVYLVGFYMQPLTRLFNVLDKQRELASFSLQRLAGIIIAMVVGLQFDDPIYMFMCLSVVSLIIGSNRARYIFKEIGVDTWSLGKKLISYLVTGCIMGASLYLVAENYELNEWMMSAAFAGVCALYYAYLYLEYRTKAN